MGFGISNLEFFQIWDFEFGIFSDLEFGMSNLEFIQIWDFQMSKLTTNY